MRKALLPLTVLAIACASCVTHRYLVRPLEFHTFDSAHDYRVVLEPLKLGIGLAYSPVNHLGVCAHTYSTFSTSYASHDNVGLSEEGHWETSSESQFSGAGGGLGYYGRLKKDVGFEVFATYDYQHARYRFAYKHWSQPPMVDVSDAFNAYLHTLRIQPGLNFADKKTIASFGIGIDGVYTTRPHYFPKTPHTLNGTFDLLLEPGFNVTAYPLEFGFSANKSIFHPNGSPYDFQIKGINSTSNFNAFNVYLRLKFSNQQIARWWKKERAGR